MRDNGGKGVVWGGQGESDVGERVGGVKEDSRFLAGEMQRNLNVLWSRML